jgi:hypothetical protein
MAYLFHAYYRRDWGNGLLGLHKIQSRTINGRRKRPLHLRASISIPGHIKQRKYILANI